MTIKWKDAPMSSMYYTPHFFIKVVDNFVFYYDRSTGFWQHYDCSVAELTPANGFTPRPVDGVWDTKELPPVGTVCEVLQLDIWCRCEIIAHASGPNFAAAIYQMERGWGGNPYPSNFRPVPNDRDKAIEDMATIYLNNGGRFAALYDAGYKKK